MKKAISLLAVPVVLLFAAGPASAADNETKSWNRFTSTDSRWHCGPTRTLWSGVQAQSCVILATDGLSYQGATIVNTDVPRNMSARTESFEAGVRTWSSVCEDSLLPAGRSVCFSKTITGHNGNAVQARSQILSTADIWTSPTAVLGS
ncbi:hypothetical protein AB0C76_15020 [Kitasatospora sp. NPDC048722]|uniref:hypothetical protein n=1 Tax=Kitasatospora sp. NPDC048722 TaxID=3155639 RepID=UPI0033F3AE77